jgi:hypothetical protein
MEEQCNTASDDSTATRRQHVTTAFYLHFREIAESLPAALGRLLWQTHWPPRWAWGSERQFLTVGAGLGPCRDNQEMFSAVPRLSELV